MQERLGLALWLRTGNTRRSETKVVVPERGVQMGKVVESDAAVLDLPRVLVVDDNPASRLTLQTVLKAGGYRVDAATNAAEAVDKLETEQYELVLSDLQLESPEAGLRVLQHARRMLYEPATALVTAVPSNSTEGKASVLIEPEDIPGLLGKVANLIADRVSRLLQRENRNLSN